jgi:shikimate dehydrogenase
MHPDKDTVVCISLAARPGNFGMTVHNAAYRELGLNFLYKAFGTDDLAGALAGVRALGIRGCSISMPFKEAAMAYVDAVEPEAKDIGAINTIVNDNGRLTGHNTDAYAVTLIMRQMGLPAASRVLLLGAGGMGKAAFHSLRSYGCRNISLCNRTISRFDGWAIGVGPAIVPWSGRNDVAADIIFNATSVGMAPGQDEMPVSRAAIDHASVVVDAVVSAAPTLLVTAARGMGKIAVEGGQLSLYQAARQFELYTGRPAPMPAMQDAFRRWIGAPQ